jgi:hypothetical protein
MSRLAWANPLSTNTAHTALLREIYVRYFTFVHIWDDVDMMTLDGKIESSENASYFTNIVMARPTGAAAVLHFYRMSWRGSAKTSRMRSARLRQLAFIAAKRDSQLRL